MSMKSKKQKRKVQKRKEQKRENYAASVGQCAWPVRSGGLLTLTNETTPRPSHSVAVYLETAAKNPAWMQLICQSSKKSEKQGL
jgi:hypothetical protein